MLVASVTIGLFNGAIPGVGSINGVAILLLMAFRLPPTSAIIFLAAIYYGALYGSPISSIMLCGIFLLILPFIRLIRNKLKQV